MHWATAWAPVNRLLIETGSTRGTLCKRYFDSGCRAFLQFLFSIPFCVHVLSSPPQDPFLFSLKSTARRHFIPLLLSRRWDWSFFSCCMPVTIKCNCGPRFFKKKTNKIIILLALQNRALQNRPEQTFCEGYHVTHSNKVWIISWRESKLYGTNPYCQLEFYSKKLEDSEGPSKNYLLFFFSSWQKTTDTDV